MVYLEGLLYSLLAKICAAQPHTIADVESYVKKNFKDPIDTWAVSEAQLLMSRAQKRRGVILFPVDKLFTLLKKVSFWARTMFTSLSTIPLSLSTWLWLPM